MKKWLLIPALSLVQFYLFAQIDSVSISVRTEDASAFQKRERFQYLRRSMIDEPRLWKVTLQPFVTTSDKYPSEQYLKNFVSNRDGSNYFHYGISNRVDYEVKVGKVVSIMPELQTTYEFYNHNLTSTINLSMRYYVGQKQAMTLGETGNNLLASYLEARVNEIFGFDSHATGLYHARINEFGYIPNNLTLSYGVQKRMGKFGFFDISGGLTARFSDTTFRDIFSSIKIQPAIKLSWGFANPPKKSLKSLK